MSKYTICWGNSDRAKTWCTCLLQDHTAKTCSPRWKKPWKDTRKRRQSSKKNTFSPKMARKKPTGLLKGNNSPSPLVLLRSANSVMSTCQSRRVLEQPKCSQVLRKVINEFPKLFLLHKWWHAYGETELRLVRKTSQKQSIRPGPRSNYQGS